MTSPSDCRGRSPHPGPDPNIELPHLNINIPPETHISSQLDCPHEHPMPVVPTLPVFSRSRRRRQLRGGAPEGSQLPSPPPQPPVSLPHQHQPPHAVSVPLPLARHPYAEVYSQHNIGYQQPPPKFALQVISITARNMGVLWMHLLQVERRRFMETFAGTFYSGHNFTCILQGNLFFRPRFTIVSARLLH